MPYYFNLPSLDKLTRDQRTAIGLPNQIALEGQPGTGKTVVSLYRHAAKIRNGIACQLLTYTTSLSYYLKECLRTNRLESAACNVATTLSWAIFRDPPERDEVIIDEAQDVKYIYEHKNSNSNNKYYFESEVCVVNSNFYAKAYKKKDGLFSLANSIECNPSHIAHNNGCYYSTEHRLIRIDIYHELKKKFNISYGADDSQMLFNGTKATELQSIFGNQPIRLIRNYRNSKKIMRLAQAVFPNANISSKDIDNCTREGNYPILDIAETEKEKINLVLNILISTLSENPDGHSIAVLCAWQKEVKNYFEFINKNFDDCSFYVSDRNGMQNINAIHVTTFKSAKGLEFDTVIIPDFRLDFNNLSRYGVSWRDYYVGVTRAKSNLYLISDSDLPSIRDYVASDSEFFEIDNRNNFTTESHDFTDDLPF